MLSSRRCSSRSYSWGQLRHKMADEGWHAACNHVLDVQFMPFDRLSQVGHQTAISCRAMLERVSVRQLRHTWNSQSMVGDGRGKIDHSRRCCQEVMQRLMTSNCLKLYASESLTCLICQCAHRAICVETVLFV